MKQTLITLSTVLFFFSCNQLSNQTNKSSKIIPPDVVINNGGVSALQPMIGLQEKPEQIIVSSASNSEIKGAKGLKISIDPSNLETENGSPMGKNITVELEEITDQQGLFHNNAATVSNGQLLVSGGSYYIGMTSEGNKLKLKNGKTLSIQVPKITGNEMSLFYGDRDSLGNLNWVQADDKTQFINTIKKQAKSLDSQIVTVSEKKKEKNNTDSLNALLLRKGGRISMSEFNTLAFGKVTDTSTIQENDFSRKVVQKIDSNGNKTRQVEMTYYDPVEIKNIGWINCDRFFNSSKTEIKCEFDSVVQTSPITMYIIFKNINSMLAESIGQNHTNSFKLVNLVPIGEPVEIFAITNKNGNFYSSRQNITIAANQNVQLKFSPVKDNEITKRIYKYDISK